MRKLRTSVTAVFQLIAVPQSGWRPAGIGMQKMTVVESVQPMFIGRKWRVPSPRMTILGWWSWSMRYMRSCGVP